MKNIRIADMTLCGENTRYSFKEKIEIARQLSRLNADVIELPQIENVRTDILLVRTVSAFAKENVLSVCASDIQSIENAAAALSVANKPRIRIELPLSTVGMEYTCHKKAPKMAGFVKELITAAKEKCEDVEFCAADATRADRDFLKEIIRTAADSGVSAVTLCDSAAEMLPDEFARFTAEAAEILSEKNIVLGVMCSDKNGLAAASAVLAVKNGAETVKTSVGGDGVQLETLGGIIKNCGNSCGFTSGIKQTELNRTVKQISWIAGSRNAQKPTALSQTEESIIKLDKSDDIDAVTDAVIALGYDLSEEDCAKVFEEFGRVAEKKPVGAKELEAIIASAAMQAPPAYTLKSYVINNGNIISASAQITLERDGNTLSGVCMGDGPVDASFHAIEQIIGHRYELDDFQIQSVTEGKEAMGSAIVKLRSDGKLYSGTGISTDIIGASIRAYINAVNKIVYEEA